MKTNIKNIISILLLSFVMISQSALLTYATSEVVNTKYDKSRADYNENLEEKLILTYDDAVEMAIKHSYKLKNQQKTTQQLQETRDQVAGNVVNTRPVEDAGWLTDMASKQGLLGLIQTDIDLAMSKIQESLQEENIAYQVRSIFDEIIKLTNQIELMNALAKHEKNKLAIQEIKVETGLESQLNYEIAIQDFEKSNKQLDSLLKSLESQYVKLNTLLGINDSEKYLIYEDISLEALAPVDLDAYTTRMINQDPYVWLQQQQIDKANKSLSLYVYTGTDQPYSVRQISVEKAKNDLSEIKQNLKESVKLRYNQIRQLEKNYEIESVKLVQAQQNLKTMKIYHDLGISTKFELKSIELAVEQIVNDMNNIALQHRNLKLLFNKPYLIPDYL